MNITKKQLQEMIQIQIKKLLKQGIDLYSELDKLDPDKKYVFIYLTHSDYQNPSYGVNIGTDIMSNYKSNFDEQEESIQYNDINYYYKIKQFDPKYKYIMFDFNDQSANFECFKNIEGLFEYFEKINFGYDNVKFNVKDDKVSMKQIKKSHPDFYEYLIELKSKNKNLSNNYFTIKDIEQFCNNSESNGDSNYKYILLKF